MIANTHLLPQKISLTKLTSNIQLRYNSSRQAKSRLNTRSDATFYIEIINYVFAKGNAGITVYYESPEPKLSLNYLTLKRDKQRNWIKDLKQVF